MAACLFGAPVFAGGGWLSFNDPKTCADPLAAGAITTVKLVMLTGEREFAGITGTAEGLVEGKRISTPLVLEKLSTPGARAIYWKPPVQGQWVLAFKIIEGVGPQSAGNVVAVVKVNSDGVKTQTVPLYLGASWLPELVESAFSGLAPATFPGEWRVPE
jgi:hypothetical protein